MAAGPHMTDRQGVPEVNGTRNTSVAEVIGNRNDRTYNGGSTIFAEVHTLGDHAHNQARVFPTLAGGVTLTGDAAAWVLGPAVQVMPPSTANDPFDVHFVNIEAISGAGVFEIVLYAGDLDVEVGRVRFGTSIAVDLITGIPIQMPITPDTDRVRARVASAAGGAQTVTISLSYHEY